MYLLCQYILPGGGRRGNSPNTPQSQLTMCIQQDVLAAPFFTWFWLEMQLHFLSYPEVPQLGKTQPPVIPEQCGLELMNVDPSPSPIVSKAPVTGTFYLSVQK